MAEAEEVGEFQYGSEEAYSHTCMVCKEDGTIIKAEGYCKSCKEYLCINCIHHHRSVRLTKSHEIIEVTDSIEEIVGQLAETTVEEDVCLDHRKAKIDMFCKDHHEVGCHHCMTLKHSKCDKENINMSVVTFEESALAGKVADLDRILSDISKAVENSIESDDKALEEYRAYLENQKAEQQVLVSQINMVHMQNSTKKANGLNEYLFNSKLKKTTIADTTKTVEALIQQSTEIQQSDNLRQKFIAFNKLLKQIPLLEDALSDASIIERPFLNYRVDEEEMYLYKRIVGNGRRVADAYDNKGPKELNIPFQHIKLDAPYGQDTMGKGGEATIISTKHICLSAMRQFENKSLEELRYEWYSELCKQNDLIPKESMGVNVFPVNLDTTAGQFTFDVWDTCGQERISELRDGFYNDGQCAIIMFDVSSPTSVGSVSKWYDKLKEQCGYIPIMVCGNKVDLASKTVKASNIAKLNKLKLPILKIQLISGKTMTNFEAPFLALARALTFNYSMEIQTKCALYPILQPGLEAKVTRPTNESAKVNDEEDL